ncbi:hypothetical protein A0H81_14825 [Grifola frondosa]|uniref:Uncharacterized protein n=1 Tax=Grifola frondosa TaxID=5627 RepID=A0A1C7LML4_GRIFR|nr:hypothetical protein A0H81_14825 [Grifola frondosa]
MGRWTQYDEDDYRLPEGMKRVGYDADTGKYYFRDQDGSLWEGPEGAQYGEMKRVSDAPIALGDHDGNEGEDEEMAVGPSRPDGYQPLAVDSEGTTRSGHILNNTTAYRVILPFFVITRLKQLYALVRAKCIL